MAVFQPEPWSPDLDHTDEAVASMFQPYLNVGWATEVHLDLSTLPRRVYATGAEMHVLVR